MATEKKQTISKHKRPPAKRAAATGGSQAFDIIPAHKVMPSSSSRPVITTTAPEQADNTLTKPAAPRVTIRTRKQVAPATDSPLLVAENDPDELKLPPLPVEDAAPDEREPLAQSGKTVAVPIGEPVLGAPSAPDTADAADDANPLLGPQDNDTAEEAPAADKPAAEDVDEQIARTLAAAADEPAETESASATQPDVEAPAEQPEETLEPAEDEEPADESAATGKSASPADEPVEADPATVTRDSVSDVLTDDTAGKPQAHSKALKDALQDMDENPQPAHHELYGGKPVIVIHRARGRHSAGVTLLWFIVCLLLAVALVDVLIDANIISLSYNIPHTNFL